jgi:hypothetical protein
MIHQRLILAIALSTAVLASAASQPAERSALNSDTELVVPLPAMKLQPAAIKSLSTNMPEIRAIVGIGTRPDLMFSDSFSRTKIFSAGWMPAVDGAIARPLGSAGRWRFGWENGLGIASWTSNSTQQLYEVPLRSVLTTHYPLGKMFQLTFQAGIRSGLMWMTRDVNFKSLSIWTRGFESALGFETRWSSTTLSIAALYLREIREDNRSSALGLNLGLGFSI